MVTYVGKLRKSRDFFTYLFLLKTVELALDNSERVIDSLFFFEMSMTLSGKKYNIIRVITSKQLSK